MKSRKTLQHRYTRKQGLCWRKLINGCQRKVSTKMDVGNFSLISLSLKKKKKKSKVENDLLAYARPVKEIKCSVGYAFLSTDALWSKQSTNFERGTFDYQNIPLT